MNPESSPRAALVVNRVDRVRSPSEVLLLASGSEVALCVDAHEQLTLVGVRSRVVSLPCWELFDRQPQAYRDQVLPPEVTARVSVEQASVRLGALRRADGPLGRYAHVRRIGAPPRPAAALRLHARARGGGGREAARGATRV